MPFLATKNTNEKCAQSGLYFCTLHPTHLIHLSKGAKFPKCECGENGKGHDTTWALVPAEKS